MFIWHLSTVISGTAGQMATGNKYCRKTSSTIGVNLDENIPDCNRNCSLSYIDEIHLGTLLTYLMYLNIIVTLSYRLKNEKSRYLSSAKLHDIFK